MHNITASIVVHASRFFHNAHFYDFNPPTTKVLFCQYSIVDCFSHRISDDLFSVNVIFLFASRVQPNKHMGVLIVSETKKSNKKKKP